MTDREFEILDELYFVISFEALQNALDLSKEELVNELFSLFEKGWVRAFKGPSETMDYEKIDEQLLMNSYLLASKKGLKAHNS